MGIDILVPVLGRPWNVEPFLESLACTREEVKVLFICSPGDDAEIAACSREPTLVVEWQPDRGDFARKINAAMEWSSAEWVFQAADDIRFREGWEQEALRVAEETSASVVGTNDLHNPLVLQGHESTHTLFRRSYIEECGGTFDGTGLVFCELYDHQYVDTEFIDTARERGVFSFAEKAVVEHLHPHWGLAETDATYEKATRDTLGDQRLYVRRRRARVLAARHARRKVRYSEKA